MEDPSFNVFLLSAAAFQEPLDQSADLSADHFGDFFIQNNVETGIAQIKSHGEEGIRKRKGLRNKDFRSGRGIPPDDHGSGAVSKENRRNQVGLRNVFALESERGKLHGDDENVSAGMRFQVIRGAAQSH